MLIAVFAALYIARPSMRLMLILNFNVDTNMCELFFLFLFSPSDKCLNIDLNTQSLVDNKIHLKHRDARSQFNVDWKLFENNWRRMRIVNHFSCAGGCANDLIALCSLEEAYYFPQFPARTNQNAFHSTTHHEWPRLKRPPLCVRKYQRGDKIWWTNIKITSEDASGSLKLNPNELVSVASPFLRSNDR